MMNRLFSSFHTPALALMLLFAAIPAFSQVEAVKGPTRDGSAMKLTKDVPIQKNPQINGTGQPTYMYVVQLARFVDMDYIPSEFPKGTFLWVSPDHNSETLLLSGFFSTYEEASADVKNWKGKPEFKAAFARKMPFLIRYD
jgi:hypothetical protein